MRGLVEEHVDDRVELAGLDRNAQRRIRGVIAGPLLPCHPLRHILPEDPSADRDVEQSVGLVRVDGRSKRRVWHAVEEAHTQQPLAQHPPMQRR